MSTRNFLPVSKWLNFAQFWLLPPTCVLCRRPGQPQLDLCQDCEAQLVPLANACPGCALPLPPQAGAVHCGRCLQGKRYIEVTVAAGAYESPLSDLITQFKYHRKLEAGRVLTHQLVNQVHERYREGSWPDVLAPIPLHPARLRQRGYNQAVLIARDLHTALGIPVAVDAIRRQRATPAQQGLSARERRRNLRGAFGVIEEWSSAAPKRIALIDDVVTTMSTVTEVARELQRCCNPAPEIHVWCLARA